MRQVHVAPGLARLLTATEGAVLLDGKSIHSWPSKEKVRPPDRRDERRSAPAGLDRDGPGPGDGPAAARRADDAPGPEPPGRGAGPAHRPQPAAGTTIVVVM